MILWLLVLFLPFFVSAYGAFILLLHSGKSSRQVLLMLILAVTAIYYFVDPQYLMVKDSYRSLALLNVFANFASLLIPPLVFCYIRLLKCKKLYAGVVTPMFIPSLVFLGALGMIYSLIGLDNVAELFSFRRIYGTLADDYNTGYYLALQFVTVKAYNIILGLEVAALVVYMVYTLFNYGLKIKHIWRFFFKGGEMTPINCQCLLLFAFLIVTSLRMALGGDWLVEHGWGAMIISLLLAFLIFAFAYIGTYFGVTAVSMPKLRSLGGSEDVHSFLRRRMYTEQFTGIDGDDEADDERIMNPSGQDAGADVHKDGTYGSLLDDFTAYFESEKPFLNPDLTVEDVASALHTNRTYVSIFVNQYFNKSFREYINTLRIEYAKEMILSNPNVVLDAVASASGFYTASQLNRKFKEIVGVTPRIWQIDNANISKGE